MRLLCLDLGTKRIGVAVSDPLGIIAQAAGLIERVGLKKTIGSVRDAVARYGIGTIIVGLPLNMDGSEGDGARAARCFSRDIERSLEIQVIMWDERLTTVEADKVMKSAGLTRKKRSGRLDSLAAQIILQSYLDSRID